MDEVAFAIRGERAAAAAVAASLAPTLATASQQQVTAATAAQATSWTPGTATPSRSTSAPVLAGLQDSPQQRTLQQADGGTSGDAGTVAGAGAGALPGR